MRVITVKELNNYIKNKIDSDMLLSLVCVRGEISNFKHYLSSGHMYFTLKDDDASISAVMYRGAASTLDFLPRDGVKVRVKGSVSIYSPTGKYQMVVREMTKAGLGDLHVAYEALKKKLFEEGLFDSERKRSIPAIPKKVGIITSKFGAALQDMLSISRRRYPIAEIAVYPSLVQGPDAPQSLIGGIEYFNRAEPDTDVIIIGRGGGSIEDLWAFNDERLARCIFDSNIPVISAVGHETDYTICDFVADLRAPTPSAAAELAFPDTSDLIAVLSNIKATMTSVMQEKISDAEALLSEYSPEKIQKLLERKYVHSFTRLSEASAQLNSLMLAHVRMSEKELLSCAELLEANSPFKILSKGYSVVTDNEGRCVSSVKTLKPADNINVSLSDGYLTATVTEITNQTT